MQPKTPIHRESEVAAERDLSQDLRGHWNLLLKRKWVLFSTIVLLLAVTAIWTLRQAKQYVATATIIIDPQAPQILGSEVQEIVQLGAGQTWWTNTYYATQVEILQSRKLALRTVRANDLGNNEAIVGKNSMAKKDLESRVEQAASILRGALTIKQDENDHIFEVRLKHTNPQIAAMLANAYVDSYKQYTLDLRTEGTEEASQWLADRLDNAENSLEESEMALLQFRRNNDILAGSLEDTRNMVNTKIDRYTAELNDKTITLIELGQLRKSVTKAMNKDVLESSIFELTKNEIGPVLKSQYYEEIKILRDLDEVFGEKEPRVKKQKRKIEELLADLNREAKLAQQVVYSKHKSALGALGEYRQKLEHWRSVAHDLGDIYNQYEKYSNKKQREKESYKLFSDRLQSSELTGKLKTINIRTLDEALAPSSHAFPRMDKNLMLAFVLALLLGTGLAFLLEFLDRSIKGIEDVEKAVSAPVLGVIPRHELTPEEEQLGSRDMLVHNMPKSRTAECCRQIRTNLLFSAAGKKIKSLVVTSPNPKEGKSTTVMYLSTTMAQAGQRVLIIDSDMRRPRLHKAASVARKIGLSNLILGDVSIEDAVIETNIPNLSILPCGPTPPNPAELLMSDQFKNVLEGLKARYDKLIFDSPPILAVTDGLMLSKHVDGTILVVRSGSTIKEQAYSSAKQLRDVDSNLTGVVLNHIDLDDRSYGYYYHYYYGYSSQEESQSSEAA